jgi:signal transduction histidine kinase
MTAADPALAPARSRLTWKLAAALLAVTGVMVLLLVSYLGPRFTASFVARGAEVIARSRATMERLAAEHTGSSRDVLIDLIDHTTDRRRRVLEDLPFSLYRGDAERIRAAIRAVDAERGERLRRNAQVLAAETQRRAAARIEADAAEVAREQTAISARFAAEQRQSYLLLAGGLLAVLILVVGVLLFRLVVRPVTLLRQATRRVALGDLDVEVPVRSRDEVGALAADFSAMVRQLRESRAELTRLNRDLEQEVARKTRHLEQALADLQATHRQLLQAEKMASIGTLAGGVAHEFNNLIGGIRGCARELSSGEQDPERRETLAVIVRASERAAAITQQLLRFARRSVDRVQPTDVAGVLDEALRLVEPEARRRDVATVRAFGPGTTIPADADALHQVFVNLFTNALQAMPGGGTLTVAARTEAGEVVIDVTDTGVGIAPEDLDHVFEPFFTRKDAEADPARRGSGLGLSVSYGIVAAHGGRISVDSRLGAGARFTVRLPAATAGPGPAAPRPPAPPASP